MSHISNQNNVLCVETHTISIPEENEFNVEVEFVNTSTDLVYDGVMSASDEGYNDSQWHETNANIFNKNINDKFNVMNTAAVTGAYHVWAAWTYNDWSLPRVGCLDLQQQPPCDHQLPSFLCW